MSEKNGLCEICNYATFKYKCPKCILKYCSVACFKSHKGAGCVQRESASEFQQKQTPVMPNSSTSHEACDLGEEETVPAAVLAKLGESGELKEMLKNGTLRSMLTQLDGAQRKELAMFQSLQEAIFVQFADTCLEVIEPHNNNDSGSRHASSGHKTS